MIKFESDLKRVERRARISTALCVATVGFVVLSGQGDPKTDRPLRASRLFCKSLVIEDKKGVGRVVAETTPNDSRIVLNDESGQIAFLVTVGKSGSPTVAFYPNNRQGGFVLGCDGGGIVLRLKDKAGTTRLEAKAGWNGDTILTVSGANERDELVLASEDNGQRFLRLVDKDGRRRAEIGLRESGDPYVLLLDENGKPVWAAPSR